MAYLSSNPLEKAESHPPNTASDILSDQDLFVAMYEKYWKKLFDLANRRLHDKDVAEELVQEIFADLWEKKNFRDIENPDSYLSSAVKFSVIDHIRRQTAKKNFLEYHQSFLEATAENQQILDYKALPELVDQGMGGLSETTKEIFRLNHFRNWKKEKIAEYLQLSEKAIEYHLTKSLKSVKIYLKNISF